MCELMPSFSQLVDLDWFHHVTSAALLSLAALLIQLISRWEAVPKRRSLAKGASISGFRRQRGDAAQWSDASQLREAFPSLRPPRFRDTPNPPFAWIWISNADLKFAL